MKLLARVVIALACATATVAVATPAFANDGGRVLTYTDREHFSGPINFDPTSPHFTHFTVKGKGVGRPLGRSSSVAVGNALTYVTTTRYDDGTITTFSPGPSGTPPSNCPTNIGVLSGGYSDLELITGGTGDFTGVSGTYITSGCVTIVVDPKSPTGFTFSGTVTSVGTITLPGDD